MTNPRARTEPAAEATEFPSALAVDHGGSGPVVVLLHGLGGCKELWAETGLALRAAGYRTIAYDHRGHGESQDVPTTLGDRRSCQ